MFPPEAIDEGTIIKVVYEKSIHDPTQALKDANFFDAAFDAAQVPDGGKLDLFKNLQKLNLNKPEIRTQLDSTMKSTQLSNLRLAMFEDAANYTTDFLRNNFLDVAHDFYSNYAAGQGAVEQTKTPVMRGALQSPGQSSIAISTGGSSIRASSAEDVSLVLTGGQQAKLTKRKSTGLLGSIKWNSKRWGGGTGVSATNYC